MELLELASLLFKQLWSVVLVLARSSSWLRAAKLIFARCSRSVPSARASKSQGLPCRVLATSATHEACSSESEVVRHAISPTGDRFNQRSTPRTQTPIQRQGPHIWWTVGSISHPILDSPKVYDRKSQTWAVGECGRFQLHVDVCDRAHKSFCNEGMTIREN